MLNLYREDKPSACSFVEKSTWKKRQRELFDMLTFQGQVYAIRYKKMCVHDSPTLPNFPGET